MKRLVAFALLFSSVFTTGLQAKDIKVKAWCPMTHASGIGAGATFEMARDAAINACISHGGQSACCNKFYRKI
jgi:hypothetical protein